MTRRTLVVGMGVAALALRGQGRPQVKALVFDTFGTVVDWRGSIIEEGLVWGKGKNLHVDWARFADHWRDGYAPAMEKVRKGQLPWTKLDDLHRMLLEDLLKEFGMTGQRGGEGSLESGVAPAEAVARFGGRADAVEEKVHDCAAIERQRGAAE